MFQLCQNQIKKPLRFSLYSVSPGHSKPILYGHNIMSVNEITSIAGKEDKYRELVNERSKHKLAATINFKEFEIVEQPSFVDYLKSGWYINTYFAIDFTASNRELHALDPEMQDRNGYELAI